MAQLGPGGSRPGDSYERDPSAGEIGGGMGRERPRAVAPATSSASGPVRRPKPQPHSVFANRRGLLLTPEQLAGPAAPNYLLRAPYVYGRQSLL